MLRHSNREATILMDFRELAVDLIGEYDGFGLIHKDNTFRGPANSSYVMSTRVEDGGAVLLRIQPDKVRD